MRCAFFESALQVYAVPAQGLGFLLEEHRVEHHAIADKVGLFVLEHSRGDGAKHILLAVKLQGVTRIGAALKACYHVVARRKYVNHFTFPFVAPLEAEQNVNFHFSFKVRLFVRCMFVSCCC